jgi:ribose-phosphate pyrophosphokinase
VICYKLRKKPNVVEEIRVIGDVAGKNIIIVDDIIDTAGTITMAANLMMDMGAVSVRAISTHPVLSGPAYERIEKSKLTEVLVSDTIPLREECSKIKVLTVADVFADVIEKVYNYQSISSNFIV